MERKNVNVDQIEKNTFNPNVMSQEDFESLKQGMKVTGPKHVLAIDRLIISPKNVFYNDPKAEPEIFVIVDGEHRWTAAKELGWDSVPCEILDIGEELARAMNYRRNRERGSLDPLKEAQLFKLEVDAGLTQQSIGLKYNVSQQYVGARLGLIKLGTKVVEIYRKPGEVFEKIKVEEFNEEHEAWKQTVQHHKEEGRTFYMHEPEIDEEDLTPRGVISGSHLEAVSSLPEKEQLEVVTLVLAKDLSVRETENKVRRVKQEIVEKKKFEEALAKAVRKKCPDCGGDPKSRVGEDKFRCGGKDGRYCYGTWVFMKSHKEADEERKARMSEQDKATSEARTERFREARENPRYIRLPETPKELHEKVKPWLLRKVHELTEIHRIQVYGKRGKDIVEIDYTPPSTGMTHMDLSFKVGDKRFGFNVQEKQYKKFEAKCRVDLGWTIKPTEKNRMILRHFFAKLAQTDKDPTDVSDEELKALAHRLAVEKGSAVDIADVVRHQKT